MNAGTNTLKLTAVDAAGNVSTTNLTLIQSSVMVTMTPLAGSQFNQPYVTVNGTVNNTAAQVYVNGIQATVNANGTWSANSVPASPVGTAVFDVEVYGGTSQNVAGGGGVHANGLPGGTATGSDQFPNVQPATVGLMSYNGNQTYTISSSFVNSSWTDTIKWSYDVGGSYIFTDAVNPINESFPPTENGEAPFDPPWQFTRIPGISGTLNVASTRSGPFTETWTWNNQTTTKVMIEPTGQTTPGQSTLYYVQACASEVSHLPNSSNHQEIYNSPEPDYDLFDGNAPTWWYGDKPLPPQWLQIQNQTLINTGITNSDGSVWGGTYITEPVGMSVDVTPTATQVYHSQDYTFDVQAKPGLMLLDLNTGTNDTLQTNTVIVGQQINLLCRTVTANGPMLSNFQWTVPGNAISNYVVAPDGSSALVATNFTTNNANVVFYWVAGASNQIVQCSATVNGKTVTAQAIFNVMSPLPSFSLQNQGPIAADTNNSNPGLWLYYGTGKGTNVGMAMSLMSVPAINGLFYGAYFVTQIIDTDKEMNVTTGTNIYGWQINKTGLDNSVRYGNIAVVAPSQLINNPLWPDSPAIQFGGPIRWVSRNDSFEDYLMFKPLVSPSISVPMFVGTWGWSGSAKTNGTSGGILLSHSQITPQVLPTTAFPTWTAVLTNNAPWVITNLPPFNEN